MLQVKGAGTVLRPAARPRPCCRPRSEGRTRVVVSHAWTREPVPYTTTSGNVVTAGLTRDGPCPSGDLLAVPDDGVYQYLAVPGTAAPALWVALGDDIVAAAEEKPEAVLPALTDLRALGVTGVSIDLHWAVFEPSPRQYNWDAYRPVFSLIRRAGLQLQANFCFHADPGGGAWTGGGGGGSGGSHRGSQLPSWVLAVGDADPEVYFADKEGNRCRECLSLGIDDVPVLAGRTPVQCHAHAVASLLASDPRGSWWRAWGKAC